MSTDRGGSREPGVGKRESGVGSRHGALQAIVFDFDGVIAESERLHLKSYQDILAPEGITISNEDYYENLTAEMVDDIIEKCKSGQLGNGVR